MQSKVADLGGLAGVLPLTLLLLLLLSLLTAWPEGGAAAGGLASRIFSSLRSR